MASDGIERHSRVHSDGVLTLSSSFFQSPIPSALPYKKQSFKQFLDAVLCPVCSKSNSFSISRLDRSKALICIFPPNMVCWDFRNSTVYQTRQQCPETSRPVNLIADSKEIYPMSLTSPDNTISCTAHTIRLQFSSNKSDSIVLGRSRCLRGRLDFRQRAGSSSVLTLEAIPTSPGRLVSLVSSPDDSSSHLIVSDMICVPTSFFSQLPPEIT